MSIQAILGIAGAICAVIVLTFMVHIKHQADLVPGLQNQVKLAQQQYASEAKAFKDSEALRVTENKAAVTSITNYQTECEERIAEAKRSAGAIKVITHETPVYDKNNCPVRTMLNSGELRDALGASH